MKAAANKIIKERRMRLGLSQKELADKAGLCLNTIYNLEANKGAAKLETYEKVCKALGIKITYLL
ncbi:helix-turn-helix transcriptional regulator [Ruminococcus sp.]|uniref:helix-turn-helix domain-containing protein n=1 Tax=Ruminococcus sp. TaxID=41978 RepID=UPI0025EC65B9|nr:helix-turn-helix transcriptional regulator [Ruminococcus sp.]